MQTGSEILNGIFFKSGPRKRVFVCGVKVKAAFLASQKIQVCSENALGWFRDQKHAPMAIQARSVAGATRCGGQHHSARPLVGRCLASHRTLGCGIEPAARPGRLANSRGHPRRCLCWRSDHCLPRAGIGPDQPPALAYRPDSTAGGASAHRLRLWPIPAWPPGSPSPWSSFR
jgi:hypothetical protein